MWRFITRLSQSLQNATSLASHHCNAKVLTLPNTALHKAVRSPLAQNRRSVVLPQSAMYRLPALTSSQIRAISQLSHTISTCGNCMNLVTSQKLMNFARLFSTTAPPSPSSPSSDAETKTSSTESKPKREFHFWDTEPRDVPLRDQPFSDQLVVFLVYVLLGFAIVRGAYELLSFPEPCLVAVKQASEHELVQRFIGIPLKASRLWHGTVQSHTANIVIPVTGPKGEGKIHARLIKQSLKPTETTAEQSDKEQLTPVSSSSQGAIWVVMTLHCQFPELGNRMTDIMPPTIFDEEESKIINELLQQHPIEMPPAVKP